MAVSAYTSNTVSQGEPWFSLGLCGPGSPQGICNSSFLFEYSECNFLNDMLTVPRARVTSKDGVEASGCFVSCGQLRVTLAVGVGKV